MKLYGYYSIENVSHGRGYGQFEANSLEDGFKFLWGEVLEIAKLNRKITECYLEYIDDSAEKVNGFSKRINYGWSLNNELFRKNTVIKQMNSHYIWVDKP